MFPPKRRRREGGRHERLDLADAILEALSTDPELYVSRLDLLAPYLMIESLFVERADREVRHTASGHGTRCQGAAPEQAERIRRRDARIFVTGERVPIDATTGIADASDYSVTTDASRSRTGGPVLDTSDRLITDRNEGRFLASVQSTGHWLGISKAILTAFTAQGIDASLTDVPDEATEVLRLTCPGIVVS